MKRAAAAAVLLAVALGASLWGQWQMRHDTNELAETVQKIQAETAAGHPDAAEATAEQLLAQWEDTSRRLCLILNHTALGECQRIIVLLPQLCREENTADTLRACELLQYQLAHLVRSEELRWENIF